MAAAVRRLVKNTATNAVALGATAFVGFALVPLLVSAYGAEGYGLLVLSRNLLPVGLLGVLTLGLPEATTRYVASYVAQNGRARAAGVVIQHMGYAFAVGAATAVILTVAAKPIISSVLRVPAALTDQFRCVIWVSAAVLPLHFAGEVCRGALEGLQRYLLVRGLEVVNAVVFLGVAVVLVAAGRGYEEVAVAYAMLSTLRYVFFWLCVQRTGLLTRRSAEMGWAEAAPVLEHAARFFQGKSMSILQTYAPSLVLTQLGGPAAVGIFDLLMRLPRLMKVFCGMLTTALLPYAAEADTRRAPDGPRRVILVGTALALVVIVPPATGIARFAGDLLRLWVGTGYDALGPWLAIGMMSSVVLAWVSIGNSMVAAQLKGIRMLNRINLVQLLVFLAVPLLLYNRIAPAEAFVLSSVLAPALVAPVQVWVAAALFGFSIAFQVRHLIAALLATVPAIVLSLVADVGGAGDWRQLVLGVRIWCLVSWGAGYGLVLGAEGRASVRRLAGMMTRG